MNTFMTLSDLKIEIQKLTYKVYLISYLFIQHVDKIKSTKNTYWVSRITRLSPFSSVADSSLNPNENTLISLASRILPNQDINV